MMNTAKIALFASVCVASAACVPATSSQTPDTPPVAATPTQPVVSMPYKALGTEPFWALQIADSQMTFQPMEGEPVVATIASARPSFNGWRYTSDTVSVDVTFSQCSDGMSDIVYKDTVTVLVGTTEYRGCGGGAVAPGTALADSAWQIVSVNGEDVYNPMGRGPLLVRFGADRLSAATGCNGMGGSYVSGEGWLYTPTLVSTMMACDSRLMAQEQAIGAALSGHHAIRNGIEGAMILGSEGGEIALVRTGDCPECAEMDGSPAMQGLTLTGDWDIRQIGDTLVTSDRPYRLNFTNGQMTGFAGCNRLFGGYTVENDTLTFGSIGATRMACAGQSGADERRVLDIIRVPLTYRFISADSMIVANASGGMMMHRAGE